MNIQEYIEKKKVIQSLLLNYIENDNKEETFQNLIKSIEDQKILNNHHEFKLLLCLILKVANNHYRTSDFFFKIEKIFNVFKKDIKKNFSNSEIFNLFKNNKRILLILIKEEIITIDKTISSVMTEYKYEEMKYPKYFFPEIKNFINESLIESNNKETNDQFEEKRKNGENDNYICQLIRNDMIDEFITYVNQTNLPLSSKIKPSIFETNSFLIKKRPSLIEYSAFFGSIQIFRYLYLNKIQLTPSLWIYAIHSQNPELIHLLEENDVQPDDISYEKCFQESIKCHHIELTNYIQNNLLVDKNKINENLVGYTFHYHNYAFFPNDFNHDFIFFYLCEFGYFTLVEFLLQTKKININAKIDRGIFNIFFFLNKIQRKIFF